MPSPIQTRGFEVSVMPDVQLADPRMFNPYGGIVDGLGAGMKLAGGLQDIVLRRHQQKLQDAQEARSAEQSAYNIGRRPTAERMDAANLALVENRKTLADAELPQQVGKAEGIVEKQTGTFTDTDEDGNEVEYGNLEFFDPVTGERGTYTGRPLRMLRTKAQIDSDNLKGEAAVRASDALANNRNTPKDSYERAVSRFQQAEAGGDPEEIQFWRNRLERLNAMPGTLAPGTTSGRRLEVLAVDAGFTQEQAAVLAGTTEGVSAMNKLGTQMKILGTQGFVPEDLKLTPAEQAAVNAAKRPSASAPARAAAPAPVPARPPAAGGAPVPEMFPMSFSARPPVPQFNTSEEAQAAYDAGQIKEGQEIRVAGQLGRWQ